IDPLREAGRTRHLKRAIDQICQVVSWVGENRPVVLAVDRYQRNVGVLPVGDRDTLLGALALGIDGEVENDLSRVERTRRPSHTPVRSRLVEELPQPAIGLVPAENKNVGRAPRRPIKRLVAEQIEMSEVPGEAAGELQLVQDSIARLQKIGTEVLVALE